MRTLWERLELSNGYNISVIKNSILLHDILKYFIRKILHTTTKKTTEPTEKN